MPAYCPVPIRYRRSYLKDKATGCWLWQLNLGRWGYGKMKIGGKTFSAHRIAWELHRGPIPNELCVLHKCDVPACVNPAHLFLGTHRDNAWDKVRKGRAPSMKGLKNSNAKLTIAAALKIKRARGTHAAICERYGVSAGTVSNIKTGKHWTMRP